MSALARRFGLWVAGVCAALTLAGCKDAAFCFDCPEDGNSGGYGFDAGTGGLFGPGGDSGPQGGAGGGSFVTGCGTPNNIAHCGACDRRCERFGATAECETSGDEAECVYECSTGFHDIDGNLTESGSNGCEYECLPTNNGEEICDDLDNDCDGDIDEGINTNNDVNHCGVCGERCSLSHASTVCDAGVCRIDQCQPGWFDIDGEAENGCEYACEATGEEICDGIDNDCDGLIDGDDPDIDVEADVRHCGSCGNNCGGQVPNASPVCVDGECAVGSCLPGFFDKDPDEPGCEAACSLSCRFDFAFAICDDDDLCEIGDCFPGYYNLDGDPANGCEYYCVQSGDEICDGKDNDCDGLVDQADPDLQTDDDPFNCGSCGNSCAGVFANSLPSCAAGECELVCINGFVDVDGDPSNGCEFNCDACFFPNATRDEPACLATGECVFEACLDGYIDLDGDPSNGCEYECSPDSPATEVCDGRDNDCDGQVDEDAIMTPQNCGGCGLDCALFFPGSETTCELVQGAPTCLFAGCQDGFEDIDGVPQNGCEYACSPTSDPTEACDGLDNDCNGIVDDVPAGSLPNACTGGNNLGRGECTATTRCSEVSPGVFAPACVRIQGPTTEVCDGKDNDCDGQTDEHAAQNPLPGVGIACGTQRGECTLGTRACVGGSLVCSGGQGPVSETCDSRDNDCDGLVDDLPDGVCGTNQGACSQGVLSCIGGAEVCIGGIPAGVEVCDGNGSTNAQFDNDCNGQVDEGCVSVSGAPIRRDRGGVAGSTTSNTGQHSSFQLTTATAGDLFFAAYSDLRDGASALFGFASIDGGQTWTERGNGTTGDFLIAGGNDPRVEPDAFARPGRAYVVFSEFGAFSGSDGDNVRRISLRAANQGGSAPYFTSWESERRLDNAPNNDSVDVYTPKGVVALAAATGTNDYLGVVWSQIGGPVMTPERDVFFAYSKDGGATWSTPVSVNNNDHQAELPVIATDGAGMVYIAWRSGGRRVFFRRIDLGAGSPSLQGALALMPDQAGIGSTALDMAADTDGNVHVAWTDLRSSKTTVRVASARNCGNGATNTACQNSWTTVSGVRDGINVSTGAVTDNASTPSIAARSGRVVVAFEDTRTGAKDIRANRAQYTGGAWNWLAEPQRVDVGDGPGATRSTHPHVAYGEGTKVFVTWEDLRNPSIAIYANISLDGGTTFYNGAGANSFRMDAFGNASAAAADSLFPMVFATPNANRAAVVFIDYHDGGNANGLNGDVYTQLIEE